MKTDATPPPAPTAADCQYSKDVGMWPEHRCAVKCQYATPVPEQAQPAGARITQAEAETLRAGLRRLEPQEVRDRARALIDKLASTGAQPAGVTEDAAEVKPDWATCETRGPWVRNGLKVRIATMKSDVARLRKAFNKPFMGEPTKWYADVVEDATAVLEKALAVLDAARAQEGEKP